MSAIAMLVHQVALAMRLHAAIPAVELDVALAQSAAAVSAETPRVSAELLLAVAFVESRYDVTATSRVEGDTRRTGHYASTEPPPQLARRASLYCGLLQTFAGSWDACVALREPHAAYAAGAAELEQWLRDKRVHHNVALALAGHGCGNAGVLTGKCNAYPARVLAIARVLDARPARPARPAPRANG